MEYLTSRGWKLYRTRFEGKPAQWVSPYENKVYSQPEAIKIEKERTNSYLLPCDMHTTVIAGCSGCNWMNQTQPILKGQQTL